MSEITIIMTGWTINTANEVVLGFSGENESKELKVKCDDLKADAAYYLDIESAEGKNIALMTAADDTLSILLTSDMLGSAGRKRMQIREVVGAVVTKSNIFIGEVNTSVNAVDEFKQSFPSEYQQYESQMSNLSKLVEELKNHTGTGDGSGSPGKKGDPGEDGKSAYELAVENGFNGSLSEWLESLKGAPGTNGNDGKSAYELAVDGGYDGTQSQWLDSLKGEPGANGSDGKSAYELAVQNGFTGTLTQWLDSLKGEKGDPGAISSGGSGDASFTPIIAQDILNLFINAAYTNDSVATALQKYATDTGLTIQVTNITLDKDSVNISEGATEHISVTTMPSFATNANNIVWASSDDSIATVDDGVITGIAPGSVTITATIGSVSASCAVTINSVSEENQELLYDFDFKKSLTDSVGNITTMLYNGNSASPTRDSSGLAFTKIQQCADYGQIYGRNRTYVMDIGECTYDQSFYGNNNKIYARLFVVDTDTDTGNGGSGFLFCSNKGASRYGWSWYMYGDGWEPSAMISSGSTAAELAECKNSLSNKTVNIYVDVDGYASVYIDGELIGMTSNPIPVYNNGHVYSGSTAGSDVLMNTVIRGLRVYDGKVISE